MNLTTEQLQTAETGPVVVEIEGKRYVVLNEDIYNRVRDAVENLRATYPAALEAWDADGSPEDETLYRDYGRTL